MLIDCPDDERPDAVVVVVDASAVARGLNVALQLAEQPYRLIIALTKTDVALNQGQTVDPVALAESTSIPVVVVDGRKREGVEKLREVVVDSLAAEPVQLREDAGLEARFAELDAAAKASVSEVEHATPLSHRLDAVALHPVVGPLLLSLIHI